MMTLQDAVLMLTGKQQKDILFLRSMITSECPTAMKALRLIDHEYATSKQHKGYNLVKRDNKKLGFVYYVRYWHEGRMLSSKWCTHTNDFARACAFAEQNRETLISQYLRKTGGDAVRFFKKFYDQKSTVYQSECRRNGELSAGRIRRYESIMTNKFIPFLKERKIAAFADITVPLLDDFQDRLLANGMKAQSVNDDLTAVSKVFKYLMRKGLVTTNPCLHLSPVPEKQEEKRTHGCYELNRMKGVFNKRWKDKTSYLLNLLIHATGMRDSEIRSFCKADIITISGCRFIDLKKSKTEYGVRLVPLHNTVYRKVIDYGKGMGTAEPLFGGVSGYQFGKACRALAKILKANDEFLKTQNITYYSGRHFWKTLMNANGLGDDVEEIFMGHRVSGDVAKLYNHHDMQGKKLIVKKAREVFKILDMKLFTGGNH